MILELLSPLQVSEVENGGTLKTVYIPFGRHPVRRVQDPTGKTARMWIILEGGDRVVGAPEGYFKQFENATGLNRVIIV